MPSIPENMPTIGTLFYNAGYKTIHFGKTHDSGSLKGFEVEPVKELPVDGKKAWPVNYDTKQDRYTTKKTVDFLNNYQKDKPYFAVAELNNPHNICGWVGENKGYHENTPISGELPPLPGNFDDKDFKKRCLPVKYICCTHRRLAQTEGWDENNFRHYLAA